MMFVFLGRIYEVAAGLSGLVMFSNSLDIYTNGHFSFCEFSVGIMLIAGAFFGKYFNDKYEKKISQEQLIVPC